MSDILTGTPADLTYAHHMVQQAWMVVWAITSGALVVILGWMGLNFIIAEHLGRSQVSLSQKWKLRIGGADRGQRVR